MLRSSLRFSAAATLGCLAFLLFAAVLSSCSLPNGEGRGGASSYPSLIYEDSLLRNPSILGGIYAAYPDNPQQELTPAPEGYVPFYVSLYNRHGSRYQPNDSRYQNTLDRLLDGHERGVLTPYGESLIPRIQQLCDSCLGHGGMLTRVGERQLRTIGRRMAEHFPEVFAQTRPDGTPKSIYARSSTSPRCAASMHAFLDGLYSVAGSNFPASPFEGEEKGSVMSYIAYDTPAMRALSAKDAPWQDAYSDYKYSHVSRDRFIQAIYTDATGVDTLQMAIDLYWLVVGMQDVDVPDCDLSDVFTPEELLQCYQCVNYRMYICNGNWPDSHDVPRHSASTLLQNIVDCADAAIETDTCCADLRFGHDSNLLRLLALIRMHNAALQCGDPAQAWQLWQEYTLSPMAANLQLVFYRSTADAQAETAAQPSANVTAESSAHAPAAPILVKLLHNEHEVLLDTDLRPVIGPYYEWTSLRSYFLSQIVDEETDDVSTINVQ